MRKSLVGSLVLLAAGVMPGLASEVRTLPPAVYGQLKPGRKLVRQWLSPGFNGTQGFKVGKVDWAVAGPDKEVVDYVPAAFGRLALPGSANVLTLAVTGLSIKERAQNEYCAATLGIEGQVLDPQGNLLMAFVTREEYDQGVGPTGDAKGAVDAVVAALATTLGRPVPRVRPAKAAAATKPALLPPPVAPAADARAVPPSTAGAPPVADARPAAAPAVNVQPAASAAAEVQPAASPAAEAQPAPPPAPLKPQAPAAAPAKPAGPVLPDTEPDSRGHHY